MTYDELKALFEKHSDEYLEYSRLDNKTSGRPDLHAFMLLDKLVPGDTDIISASEHDEFFLETDVEALAATVTEEQVIELLRCGVRLDTSYGCLSMFS